jgi:hypothetical protein
MQQRKRRREAGPDGLTPEELAEELAMTQQLEEKGRLWAAATGVALDKAANAAKKAVKQTAKEAAKVAKVAKDAAKKAEKVAKDAAKEAAKIAKQAAKIEAAAARPKKKSKKDITYGKSEEEIAEMEREQAILLGLKPS